MRRFMRRSAGLLGLRMAARSASTTQRAHQPPRNRSASAPHFAQSMSGRVIPAQSRHIARPFSSRPGSSRSSPQVGQRPNERTASVKQAPQIAPSGQCTRIFATLFWHRSHCLSPTLRGRPRFLCGSSVSIVGRGTRARIDLLIVVEQDSCTHRAVIAQFRNVVAHGLLRPNCA